MGGGPVQAVFDGALDANINPDTVDQRHSSSSSTVGDITRHGGGMTHRRVGL
jgi:hypothetical protein